ncbi:MAG TPA: IscS subfamily cysteine desulfurase [Ktedonobacterales bacterium]|nr:IscS subfamily cysteine desulfurase [Ktedonobacterales bacterium]
MALADGTIYLDHAATTPTRPEVVAAMLPFFSDAFGNPSSIYALGRQSHQALDNARRQVAQVLNCRPTEIVFTGGGSEADNLAIRGIATAPRRRGQHLITSALEHHAVLHTCQSLEHQGFTVTYLPVDSFGRVSPAALAEALRDDTALVSIMYANNEIGTIQPITELGALCRARGVPFHVDAVQAGPSLRLDVTQLQTDLLTLSAHKFYGPKGVGILYVRQGTRIQPQVLGGSQERNRRAGTENVAGVVGAAAALTLAYQEQQSENIRLLRLRERLIAGILRIAGTRLTGHPDERLPNSASFVLEGVEGESLLLNLDLLGIAASSGSACTTGDIEPSHVLTAIGLTSDQARGHLRLTLGHSNTDEDVDAVLRALPEVVARVRGLSTSLI